MKKLTLIATLLGLAAAAVDSAHAANAPVNIAAPINNTSVTNYFSSSFTSTCPAGSNFVYWYLDSTPVGNSTFYNSINVNFAHKLPTGWHTLTVKATCGNDAVKFYVQ